MKIVIVDGCTCGSIEIDGEGINDLSPEKRKETWDKVLDALKEKGNPEDLNDLLWWLNSSWKMPEGMEQEYCYTCECCGDSVYETKWEI